MVNSETIPGIMGARQENSRHMGQQLHTFTHSLTHKCEAKQAEGMNWITAEGHLWLANHILVGASVPKPHPLGAHPYDSAYNATYD